VECWLHPTVPSGVLASVGLHCLDCAVCFALSGLHWLQLVCTGHTRATHTRTHVRTYACTHTHTHTNTHTYTHTHTRTHTYTHTPLNAAGSNWIADSSYFVPLILMDIPYFRHTPTIPFTQPLPSLTLIPLPYRARNTPDPFH